jgi:ferredoxin
MDFYLFVEGPLLWIVFILFLVGLAVRLGFSVHAIVSSSGNRDQSAAFTMAILGRFLVPFHMAVAKRPFYAIQRYIFHICLFVVPIWLSAHVLLWSESRFEWEWTSLPDVWADWMTLLLLALAALFLMRRIISAVARRNSGVLDHVIIIITALPFVTGYFLKHGTLDSISFLGDNMALIHMLSGEAMILMAVFLFCRTRLDALRCIGCASCVENCPTETLESRDEENVRHFSYSHFQCICCGSCVRVCPEDAAELRHEISPKRLFQVVSKQEIQAVELAACERCGALFAPQPQMKKIGQTFAHDYLRLCPDCRKLSIGDTLHQLSPWHKGSRGLPQQERQRT